MVQSDPKSPSARGEKGGKKHRKNIKERRAQFPLALLAVLNAWHIHGNPDDLIIALGGQDIASAEKGAIRTTMTGELTFTSRPWSLSVADQAADVKLMDDLTSIAAFHRGDPTAPEPLHLIPLHIAALVARRMAEHRTAAPINAISALNMTARNLLRGVVGKPTTSLESLGARVNCFHAIAVIQALDRVPSDVFKLLGRCQNPRCPNRRPFGLGKVMRFNACSTGCRVRLWETRQAVRST